MEYYIHNCCWPLHNVMLALNYLLFETNFVLVFFFRPIYPHRLITVSEDEWSSCFYTIPVLTYCSHNIADHSIKWDSEHVKAIFCEGLDVLQYVDKYALEARDIVAEKRDFHYGCSM